MTAPRRILAALALAAATALQACTVNPATGQQSFTAFMSPEDELRVGAEEHPKILKSMGGEYKDPPIETYVDWMGQRLAKVSDLPNLKFRFTVLNTPDVNAFALPGGYVYITRGLIALAENEAEIAGVLAHEIGHVTARHTAQRYSTAMATNIGLTAAGILGSALGVPGQLNQIVGQGAQLALQAYSREQELEADMLGVRYMTRAGYSPNALESFFHKMQQETSIEQRSQGKADVDPAASLMSTHPRTAERIAQAIRLAGKTPVPNPRIGRPDYLSRVNGMVWGDSPDQGVVTGRVFAHPDLKFRFEVPPDFVIHNTPRQVVGYGPNKARIVFNMLDPKKARDVGSLKRYVGGWSNGRLGRVEGLTINGMEAATGAARVETNSGSRDLRLVAIRDGRDRIYRLFFLSPPAVTTRMNEDFRRTTYSFRRLSDAEAKAVKPLMVRVVGVKPGDTQESLAARMPMEKFSLDWLRAINGLNPGGPLPTDGKVKLITR